MTVHSSRTLAAAAALVTLTAFAGAHPALADGSTPNPNETVSTAFTATDLAASLVGAGVSVSNATLTGAPDAIGHFVFSDPTVVGFGQGLVMSSGKATDVVGPNVSDWTSTDWGLVPPYGAGDPDLDTLSGFVTQDAVVLEFDFTPTANQVVFQYAFASDEYPEYVNTQFNDVFAFFVNGVNCATVRQVAGDPASPFVPVAVNNINNSNPTQNPQPVAMRPDLFRPNYFNPSGPSALDLEQDGITSVLTCQSPVNPGVTNHMKLAIADASDGIFDSAVFIQSGSLVSNENPVADLSVSPETGTAPLPVTAAVEGEDPNGASLTYDIDWGDGTAHASGSLPDATTLEHHTYTTGGHFTVILTVSNGTLSGTSTEDLDVTAPPDTTPPTLAPSFSTTQPFLRGATGITAWPNATDDSGIASQSCDPVVTTSVGSQLLTCRATDNAGNPASVDVSYVVGFGFTGVSPASGTSFRRTASIPVAFKLVDAAGVLSDTESAGLRSSITVTFGSLAGVHPTWNKKTHQFTASLKIGKPSAGAYSVTVDVVSGGVTIAHLAIPVTIV